MGREVISVPYVGPPKVRCSAHKKTGEQCKKWAIRGGTVCRFHGGAAGQVKRKAAARIEASLDRAAIAIVRLMENDETPPAVKLAAARDLLDRGNLTGKHVVEVEGMKPWQVILSKIVVGGTVEDESVIVVDNVVEAEWYEDEADSPSPSSPPYAQPEPVVPRDAGTTATASFDDYPPAHIDPDHVVRPRRGHTKFSR